MIIGVINQVSFAILKSENYAPVSGNLYGPVPLKIAFERVQPGARVVHIAHNRRGVQPVQYVFQLPSVFGLNPLFCPIVEQCGEPFVPEAFNHYYSVTLKVTGVNGYFEGVLTPGSTARSLVGADGTVPGHSRYCSRPASAESYVMRRV